MNLDEAVKRYQTYFCLDCGVCTASCPVSRVLPTFSPRLIVEKVLLELGDEVLAEKDLWSCLTCGRCFERCPTNIDFPEFMRVLREEASSRGRGPSPAHHGMLQTVMELQTQGIRQHRTAWAREAGRIAETGDVFFFVGCMPYFDVVLRDLAVDSLSTSRRVLQILNAAGIVPVVSDRESCCGHDMLWNGRRDVFEKLARQNVDLIRESGAKQVIFSCPEGYQTFKKHYPEVVGPLGFEVVHFYDFIERSLLEGRVSLKANGGSYTYHDPCRLGRMAKIYDSPRRILEHIPGGRLVEMERNRENAVCCGTTGWANCSTCSKQIQVERLHEAVATGAETLVTACPKCQIHLSCALSNMNAKIHIKDLITLVSESIES